MHFTQYEDFLIKTAESLLAIDSPSGFTDKASEYVLHTDILPTVTIWAM